MSYNFLEELKEHVSKSYNVNRPFFIENVNSKENIIITDKGINSLIFHSSWKDKGICIVVRENAANFSLIINESTRIHKLCIQDGCQLESLLITDSELSTVEISASIEKELGITSCKIGDMSLKQKNHIAYFYIANNTIIINLNIEKCTFKNTTLNTSAILVDKSSINNLSIKDINFKYIDYSGKGGKSVVIMFCVNYSTFGKLTMENVEFEKAEDIRAINLSDSKIEHLAIKSSKVAGIHLASTYVRQGLISNIENSNSISFTNFFPVNSFLQFNDVKTDSLSFQNFTNFGDLRFVNVCKARDINQDTCAIQISYSDLGKVHFYNCDLGGEKGEIDFAHSRIQDVVILGKAFPCKIVENNKLSKVEKDGSELLLLSQLTRIFHNNNDIANAIHYHSLELDALRRQKRYRRKVDWLALSLNKISNNYGDGLGRSIGLLLLVSMCCYTLYIRSRGYRLGCDWNMTKYVIGGYFEFLSPVHKANFIIPAKYFENQPQYNSNNEVISGYTLFISGLSKIIISYFIYQFIQAFRKYGRRS